MVIPSPHPLIKWVRFYFKIKTFKKVITLCFMENLICKHIVLSPSYPQNSQEFKEVWVNEFVDWIRNNSTYHSIFLEHPDTNAHLDILVWFPKSQRWDNYSRNLKKLVTKFIDSNPCGLRGYGFTIGCRTGYQFSIARVLAESFLKVIEPRDASAGHLRPELLPVRRSPFCM